LADTSVHKRINKKKSDSTQKPARIGLSPEFSAVNHNLPVFFQLQVPSIKKIKNIFRVESLTFTAHLLAGVFVVDGQHLIGRQTSGLKAFEIFLTLFFSHRDTKTQSSGKGANRSLCGFVPLCEILTWRKSIFQCGRIGKLPQ
jgi:hypothetical protein